ncbi:hypothetical protein F8388_022956 [Cannabis sativa]|uniref:Uncharacterized protein n=1 Tax=Cannabis sativa TaxID=3483 RepID=A0A7J6FWR2_CANSA|nr:hypothetical protein F8388_022956 [Cannabis sativa]
MNDLIFVIFEISLPTECVWRRRRSPNRFDFQSLKSKSHPLTLLCYGQPSPRYLLRNVLTLLCSESRLPVKHAQRQSM